MLLLLALLAAAAAFLSYRFLESWTPRSWLPALARATGWGTLALLVLNAGCPAGLAPGRPLVLLDASLSMQAAGGRWTEALALARRTGDVRFVGVPPGDTTPSAGQSELASAIVGAEAGGRPVVVVTDGEVGDAAAIPEASRARVAVRVLERRPVADVALTRVGGTLRLTRGDTLRLGLEAVSVGGGGGQELRIEVREDDRLWLTGRMPMDAGGRGVLELAAPLPAVAPGEHLLSVAIVGARDAEPRNDVRLLRVTVVPTPGVVLVASPPTWESRFLLATLEQVAALPARGYLEVEPGRWRRAGSLAPLPATEVREAVRRADLLVTLGSVADLTRGARARARLAWMPVPARAGAQGDWYLDVAGGTPVSDAAVGLPVDSFPPGTAIAELAPRPGDWVGLTAQAGRRGAVRPALIGRDSAGTRTVMVGVEGLWRWHFRGGSSEQGYRGLVAAAVTWLLGGADPAQGRARPLRPVVSRGRAVLFEWTGTGPPAPVTVTLTGPGGARRDTLVFDGAGRAALPLPPGRWRYRLDGGGEGLLGVEEYSDEWLPAPRTLAAGEGRTAAGTTQVPLRSRLWLFGLAGTAFAAEWLLRRRMGLR